MPHSSDLPKSIDDLAELLNADPKREAVDSARGYDWQRWLTIQHWLALEGEDRVWIEFAEDITVSKSSGIITIQAKDREAKITLGQAKIRKLVSDGLRRGKDVRTVVWTRSAIGNERNLPLEQPGITHWKRVVEGEVSPSKLRDYLLREGVLVKEAQEIVRHTGEADLVALFDRIEWVTDEPEIEQLRCRVIINIENRLQSIGIPGASTLREHYAGHVFARVAEVGVNRDLADRYLTRPGLDKLIGEMNTAFFNANLPGMQGLFRPTVSVPELGRVIATHLASSGDIQVLKAENRIVSDALGRELEARFIKALQRSAFQEAYGTDEFKSLASELADASYLGVDVNIRQRVLLYAARSSAVRGEIEASEKFLDAAKNLNGSASDLIARARIEAAKGNYDVAIRLLRDVKEPDAQSVLLSILLKEKGPEAVRDWLTANPLAELTAAGVTVATAAYVGSDLSPLQALAESFTPGQIQHEPYLLFFRAVVRFASIFPASRQIDILRGSPMDIRGFLPAITGEKLARSLAAVSEDLAAAIPVLSTLNLIQTTRLAEMQKSWCSLLSPQNERALESLRHYLERNPPSLWLLQLSFAFDTEFDQTRLEARLISRKALGGWSRDELHAALIIKLHQNSPQDVVEFVNANRADLIASYGQHTTTGIEIQALAKAGNGIGARRLLEDSRAFLPEEATPLLEAEVAIAEGKDIVEEHLSAFDATGDIDALRTVVHALDDRKDYAEHARRAEQFFELSGEGEFLLAAAWSCVRNGDDDNLMRLVTQHSEVIGTDSMLQRHFARALMRAGDILAAQGVAQKLRSLGHPERDLELELFLTLETGSWDDLGGVLSAYLDPGVKADGQELIRAAHISQAINSGPLLKLLTSAVAESPSDPRVLLSAYTIAMAQDADDLGVEAGLWFKTAVELSGPEGPVYPVDLKEVIEQQQEWERRATAVTKAVVNGEVPLLIAAPDMGESQVELVLRNLTRNARLADPRQKVTLPLFSGRRTPVALNSSDRIVFDISALAVLGWLGLLPTVFATYKSSGIPAHAMTELFEGQRSTRLRQKSQFTNAKALRELVRDGLVKSVPTSGPRDELASEFGAATAALVRSANASNGIVVYPPPVHRAGSPEENATLDLHLPLFVDMHNVLDSLSEQGGIDLRIEESARRFFDIQVQRWDHLPPSLIGKPIYLSGLAIDYLQTTQLLGPMLAVFRDVWTDDDTIRRAMAMVDTELDSENTVRHITAIRKAVADADVRHGRQRHGDRSETGKLRASSLNLFMDLEAFDLAVFDDRAINKLGLAEDDAGRTVRTATTLDILLDLVGKGIISQEQHFDFIRRLRLGGAMLIPVTTDELLAAVRRSRSVNSPEFRAIGESLDLALLAELPRFPDEIPWFSSTISGIKNALMDSFVSEDPGRAAQICERILELVIDPEDWVFAWGESLPLNWAEAVTQSLYIGFAFPIELKDESVAEAFSEWAESRLWSQMREMSPRRYGEIILRLKSFVSEIARTNGDSDDAE